MATVIESKLRDQLVSRQRRLQALARDDPREYVQQLLEEVDDALTRLDDGSFGLCAVCQEPVEGDRLLADPLARVCLECLSPAQIRALENDLELAARVQRGLLPPAQVDLAGWRIRTYYRPLGPVSGDFYDLVRRDGGTLVLFGDIAGKGVAASILMSSLHALFRTLAATELSIASLVGHAGRLFRETTVAGSYATLLCASIAPSGDVALVNAGHNPPLVRRRGNLESLPATGLPVGLFADVEYAIHRRQLEPGDALLFYTDGLSEARNARGEEYGTARIEAVLARAVEAAGADIGAALLADETAFRRGAPRTDDLTVMVVERSRQTVTSLP
jgi:sigma-B regulation protein RsbU (phosphoserine phosphatase)